MKNLDLEDAGMIPVNEIEYWASLGNLKRLQTAIDSGADVNEKSEDGYTALHAAAENGHLAVVRLLLEHGAIISSVSSGETPIDLAVQNGYDEIANLLKSKQAQ